MVLRSIRILSLIIFYIQGKQLHAHDYKDYTGFEDKRVVVIGIGNSGGDIAVELGRCAKQVCKIVSSDFICEHKVAKRLFVSLPFPKTAEKIHYKNILKN